MFQNNNNNNKIKEQNIKFTQYPFSEDYAIFIIRHNGGS